MYFRAICTWYESPPQHLHHGQNASSLCNKLLVFFHIALLFLLLGFFHEECAVSDYPAVGCAQCFPFPVSSTLSLSSNRDMDRPPFFSLTSSSKACDATLVCRNRTGANTSPLSLVLLAYTCQTLFKFLLHPTAPLAANSAGKVALFSKGVLHPLRLDLNATIVRCGEVR